MKPLDITVSVIPGMALQHDGDRYFCENCLTESVDPCPEPCLGCGADAPASIVVNPRHNDPREASLLARPPLGRA